MLETIFWTDRLTEYIFQMDKTDCLKHAMHTQPILCSWYHHNIYS